MIEKSFSVWHFGICINVDTLVCLVMFWKANSFVMIRCMELSPLFLFCFYTQKWYETKIKIGITGTGLSQVRVPAFLCTKPEDR